MHDLKELLARNTPPHLIDVRDHDEFRSGHIEGAQHIYVGQIEERLASIPEGAVVTYCASGRRALVAAAALKRLGRTDVRVCWGSMKAWRAAGYPVVR